VDVHEAIGRWGIHKGRSSRRGRILHDALGLTAGESADPARLGEDAEGEAEVGGGVTDT